MVLDCPCTVTQPVKPTYAPHPTMPTAPYPPKNETSVYITTTVSEYTTYCKSPNLFYLSYTLIDSLVGACVVVCCLTILNSSQVDNY